MSVCQLILSTLQCVKGTYDALCHNSEVRISMFRAVHVIQSTPKVEITAQKVGILPQSRIQSSIQLALSEVEITPLITYIVCLLNTCAHIVTLLSFSNDYVLCCKLFCKCCKLCINSTSKANVT